MAREKSLSRRAFKRTAKKSGDPADAIGRSFLACRTVTQFAAQDLADVALWQVLAELDLPRHLVASQIGAAVRDQLLGSQRLIFLDHKNLHHLAGSLDRHTDRCHLQHARMHGNHFFNLIRINI